VTSVSSDASHLILVLRWQRYRKVEVEPGSDEYVWVSSTFHQTMSWPRAHILRIHRVQNQTLWQFYVV